MDDLILKHYDEIYHYGVVGMKWGVRKNPSITFAKSTRKANTLKKRSANLNLKSAKLKSKALNTEIKASNERDFKKARKLRLKASAAEAKSYRNSAKAEKWINAMEQTFSGVKLTDISGKHFDIGRQYIYMLTNN